METASEHQPQLNKAAVTALSSHKKAILDGLAELERSDRDNIAFQEIDDRGGIGIFGMILSRIEDAGQMEDGQVGSNNAGFIVAYLNSGPIQDFIVEKSEGELTLNDVSEIRDFFSSQL